MVHLGRLHRRGLAHSFAHAGPGSTQAARSGRRPRRTKVGHHGFLFSGVHGPGRGGSKIGGTDLHAAAQFVVDAQGGIELLAGASSIKLGPAGIELKGPQIRLNGDGMVDVNAGGILSLSGSLITVSDLRAGLAKNDLSRLPWQVQGRT